VAVYIFSLYHTLRPSVSELHRRDAESNQCLIIDMIYTVEMIDEDEQEREAGCFGNRNRM
jgi:hypothetical protein